MDFFKLLRVGTIIIKSMNKLIYYLRTPLSQTHISQCNNYSPTKNMIKKKLFFNNKKITRINKHNLKLTTTVTGMKNKHRRLHNEKVQHKKYWVYPQ